MELFNRLFTKRKLEYYNHETRNRDRSYQITLEQVRLLLFKECDWRGRKVLFDSSTIEKVPAGKNDKPYIRQTDEVPCIVEVAGGFSYVYKGPAADAGVLGEMIFGAVAMNYKGVSFKIHIMDEPRRLMCTKVFSVPTSRRISRVDRKAGDSSADVQHTKPLNVPALREEGVSLSFSLDRGDSGFYGDHSPYSSVGSTNDYFSMFDIWEGGGSPDDFFFHSPPGRKLSTSSNGSWQRRTFQNAATKFELGQQSCNLLNVPTATSNVTSLDSQVFSNSSTSGTSDSLASTGTNLLPKKSKLGLALLITAADPAELDLVKRCVEHSPQLQALVCRLRLAALAAGAAGAGGFVATLYGATQHAATWLSDLMYGPRLQPLWLGLTTAEPHSASKMADGLLTDLCAVLAVGDTKHTNFFISTLLTHVLTYHLGWVATVSPYDALTPQQPPGCAQRPYNALWAQLNDLCGAIGYPPRAARTLIAGTNNAQFVKRLLFALTYFVRSGDVTRTEFVYEDSAPQETKVISVTPVQSPVGLKRTKTVNKMDNSSKDCLVVPQLNTQSSDSSVVTVVGSDASMKRTATLANLSQKLSTGLVSTAEDCSSMSEKPMTSQLKRNPTMLLTLKASSDSSLNSSLSEEADAEQNVVFVLGDDEKLVGLKNKSNGGKSVKKSAKVFTEPPADMPEEKSANKPEDKSADKPEDKSAGKPEDKSSKVCAKENCDQKSNKTDSPSKCCGQTLQHSKPIKHSGFKFEFDKYPQIVTNYMKSKNLEILDRHYIGKPGNLKLDNFQFDPNVVPPIQEERCETCDRCQQMEATLQTPTNASEMEYMNDIPRQAEPQFATPVIQRESPPKSFIRATEEDTLVVNVSDQSGNRARGKVPRPVRGKETVPAAMVREVAEFPMPRGRAPAAARAGFNGSLLAGVTDHYVPDLVLQGTQADARVWEPELRRDLDLTSLLNKNQESPLQAVAIIGDTNKWEVRVWSGAGAASSGGLSPLVGAALDALPAMRSARVPAAQCLHFLEGKLRELCVLSKTLADMLMTTDFCDIATLTRSLNIDVNDVPLLLAVATTHTPQVATRYGISYR